MRVMFLQSWCCCVWRETNLCFTEKDDEVAFKTALETRVASAGRQTSIIWAIVCILATGIVYTQNARSPHLSPSVKFCLIGWLTTAAVAGAYATLSSLRLQKGWFANWDWERYFLSSVLFIGVSICLANKVTAPLLLGEEPDEVWATDPREAAINVPMCLTWLIMAVSLFVPVRVSRLWVLQTLIVCLYAMSAILIGSLLNSGPPICVLAGIALYSQVGAVRKERNEREEFLITRKAEVLRSDLELAKQVVGDLRFRVLDYEATISETKNEELKQKKLLSVQEIELQVMQSNMREQQLRIQEQDAQIKDLHLEAKGHQLDVDERDAVIQNMRNRIQALQECVNQRTALVRKLKEKEENLENYLREQQDEIADQMGPLPILPHLEQQVSKGRSTRCMRPAPRTCFDGSWELISGNFPQWLQTLTIVGDMVTVGDGTRAWLKRAPEGHTTLEGGFLSLDGHVLQRHGRSGLISAYRQQVEDFDEDAEYHYMNPDTGDDGDDDDRDTLSDGYSTCFSYSSNSRTTTFESLDELIRDTTSSGSSSSGIVDQSLCFLPGECDQRTVHGSPFPEEGISSKSANDP